MTSGNFRLAFQPPYYISLRAAKHNYTTLPNTTLDVRKWVQKLAFWHLWVHQPLWIRVQIKLQPVYCSWKSESSGQENKQHQIREGCCEIHHLSYIKNIRMNGSVMLQTYTRVSYQKLLLTPHDAPSLIISPPALNLCQAAWRQKQKRPTTSVPPPVSVTNETQWPQASPPRSAWPIKNVINTQLAGRAACARTVGHIIVPRERSIAPNDINAGTKPAFAFNVIGRAFKWNESGVICAAAEEIMGCARRSMCALIRTCKAWVALCVPHRLLYSH